MILLGRNRMLRVVDVRPATDGGEEPVLVVVEDEPVRYPPTDAEALPSRGVRS
jgi:hypothetical protein